MTPFHCVGETVLDEAKVSRASILLYWLSVPSVLLLFFMATVFPKIVAASLAADAVGSLDDSGTLNRAFGTVGAVFVVIGLVIGVILLLSWVAFCAVTTSRILQNSFVITETYVRGKSRDRELIAPLKDVKDIFVEQTLIGQFLNYGSITVTSQKGSITIHNIENPRRFRQFFLHNAELFPGGGLL